jgi:hypothetical protein
MKATATKTAAPAYVYASTLRVRPAKPVNGLSEITLDVVADDRVGDVPARLQADLVDLGNGYHLIYGSAEFFMLGNSLDRCERLAVAALAAGKVYRPAGCTPADAERAADIFVE